jgi:hypothetical protein
MLSRARPKISYSERTVVLVSVISPSAAGWRRAWRPRRSRKAADAAMYQIGTDWDEDEPEFPEQDGPVFLLGTCVLVDAVWAAVGEDSLIGAFSTEYRPSVFGITRFRRGCGLALRCLAVGGGGRRVGGSVENGQRLVIVDHDVPPEVRTAAEVARGGLIVEGTGSRVPRPKALRAVRRSALGRPAAVLVGVICHVVLLRQGSLIHMARGT